MTMRRWVDWVNVGLGVWLIASPWLLTAAAADTAADWSAWSVGVAIVTVAFFAMYKSAVWGDALGVMLGVWLIASPWMLGFASASALAANGVVLGMLVDHITFSAPEEEWKRFEPTFAELRKSMRWTR